MITTRQPNPNKPKLNARIVGLIVGGIGSVAAMGCGGSIVGGSSDKAPTPVTITSEGHNKDGSGYVTITDADGNKTSYKSETPTADSNNEDTASQTSD